MAKETHLKVKIAERIAGYVWVRAQESGGDGIHRWLRGPDTWSVANFPQADGTEPIAAGYELSIPDFDKDANLALALVPDGVEFCLWRHGDEWGCRVDTVLAHAPCAAEAVCLALLRWKHG